MRVLLFGNWMENVQRAFKDHQVATIEPSGNAENFANVKLAVIDFGPELLIAFPPCKYLCSSGLHWNTRRPERMMLTEQALTLVQFLLQAPIPRIALENPVGCISSHIRKPDQIIQPWEFGHDASKKTCLWLKGLPHLSGTKQVAPRIVNGRQRWGNQFDSGQNNQINATDRTRARAERWQGVCDAMAAQWTC